MGIILPVGMANFLNTPAAITDIIGNQMPAIDVPNGTIYIAPDVPAIYTNDNGTWVQLSGGGGGGSSTGINGLNGTTNIGLGGTLLNTSFIDGAHYDFTIDALGKLTFDSESFVFTAATTIQLFDANVNLVTLGIKDLSSTDEISLSFDRADQSIYVTHNNIQDGLQLDFLNHIFKFGNYSNLNNQSKIIINDDIATLRVSIEGNTGQVLGINTDDGFLILNKYGAGTFANTPVYLLGVDINGNVIEAPLSLLTPSIDDVLAVGQALTNTRIIDCNNNGLSIYNASSFNANTAQYSFFIDESLKTIATTINNFYFGIHIFDNGFKNIFIGDSNTNFGGTTIQLLDSQKVIKTFNLNTGLQFSGFLIDQNTKSYQFGDDINLLFIDNTSGTIQTYYNSQQKGLNFDFINNLYIIGDTPLYVELSADPSALTYILSDSVGLSGIYINYTSLINYVGWIGGVQDLSMRFDLITGKIQSYYNFTPKGVDLDLINEVYYFGGVTTSGGSTGFKAVENTRIATIGDVDGNGNGTNFGTDDLNQTLFGSSNLISTPITVAPTLNFIKINISGVDYLIPLFQ